MNRIAILIVASILSITAASNAAVPASVLRVVKQVNEYPVMIVECTVNGHAASLTTSGECFHLDLGNAEVYYDGKTQWSYLPSSKEVTILNPTPDELAGSNPLGILRNLEKDFNGEALKSNPNTVRLTPINATNPVTEATVTFNPTTGWPTHITIISGGQRAELSNMHFSQSENKKPEGAFTFQPPKGTIITDLR